MDSFSQKWEAFGKDVSSSDDEAESSITTISSESFIEKIPTLKFLNSTCNSSTQEEGNEFAQALDTPSFHALRAHCMLVLKSRDPKVLNAALVSIQKSYVELEEFQSFAFSKFVLLPILVLLRESAGTIHLSDRTVELALQAADTVLCAGGIWGAEGLDLFQAATRSVVNIAASAGRDQPQVIDALYLSPPMFRTRTRDQRAEACGNT